MGEKVEAAADSRADFMWLFLGLLAGWIANAMGSVGAAHTVCAWVSSTSTMDNSVQTSRSSLS